MFSDVVSTDVYSKVFVLVKRLHRKVPGTTLATQEGNKEILTRTLVKREPINTGTKISRLYRHKI